MSIKVVFKFMNVKATEAVLAMVMLGESLLNLSFKEIGCCWIV